MPIWWRRHPDSKCAVHIYKTCAKLTLSVLINKTGMIHLCGTILCLVEFMTNPSSTYQWFTNSCGYLALTGQHGNARKLRNSCSFKTNDIELVSKRFDLIELKFTVQFSSVQFSLHPNCSKVQLFRQTRVLGLLCTNGELPQWARVDRTRRALFVF